MKQLSGNVVNCNSGIYKITNLKTERYYIGSSERLKQRFSSHLSELRRNQHKNTYLQNSFNKYGKSSFSFEVLQHEENKEKLIPLEQYWLNLAKSEEGQLYNICPIAGTRRGVPLLKNRKEYCIRGHLRSPENLWAKKDCKKCNKLVARNSRLRRGLIQKPEWGIKCKRGHFRIKENLAFGGKCKMCIKLTSKSASAAKQERGE